MVKRGADGAMVATADGRLSAPAVAVPVIDTVGAGDAFVAGWLADLARGATLRQCLDTALACGAFACTGEGDWESAPSRDDLGGWVAGRSIRFRASRTAAARCRTA